MRTPYFAAIGLVCSFFFLVLSIAFCLHPHYPLLVLLGEDSVGTWMSGVLLVISATLSLVIGIRLGVYPWYAFTLFLFLLALDERFMFHEQAKTHLIFTFYRSHFPHWLYELPVILGAGGGLLVTKVLCKYLTGKSRILLLCAAVGGFLSAAIDVLAAGAFWEEAFKLTSELLLACALLLKVER